MPLVHKKAPPNLWAGGASYVWIEIFSLPLDRCWWFGGHIVADAVDATHIADDLVADFGKELVGEFCPVGCHGVRGYALSGAPRLRLQSH